MFRPSIRAEALSYRFGGDVTQPFRVDPGSAGYAASFMPPCIKKRGREEPIFHEDLFWVRWSGALRRKRDDGPRLIPLLN
jgi:hypothetical protein